MHRVKCTKILYFLNIISVVIIVILFSNRNSRIITSHSFHPLFREQRTSQLLTSYSHIYEQTIYQCNTTLPLTDDEKNAFNMVAIKMATLRIQLIPYPNEYFQGRGIVLTTGKKQFKFARINLKMLEITGTRLPVQIWYSSYQISHVQMLSLLLAAPSLNASVCCFLTAECRTLTNAWLLNTTYIYKPPPSRFRSRFFPYKPAAIVSATFSEVLFLDCDAYVTRDLEELFVSDPMYLKFGALFYPDAFKSRQHPMIWDLLNISCAENEYEFDSAMILVDKRKVWEGLYMAKLINDHYKTFYKHVTDGDKDTFRLAFRYMQVKYYLVMTPCSSGTYNGSHFCGHTLCKTDSLSQHIYVNHAHLFKYENIKYSPSTLDYTRIGLGDPNDNSFLFQHCQLQDASTSCFHILKEANEKLMEDQCYVGGIPLDEIEDHEYKFDESLITEKSKDNRVLLSKTDNLIPHFVDQFLRFVKAELD